MKSYYLVVLRNKDSENPLALFDSEEQAKKFADFYNESPSQFKDRSVLNKVAVVRKMVDMYSIDAPEEALVYRARIAILCNTAYLTSYGRFFLPSYTEEYYPAHEPVVRQTSATEEDRKYNSIVERYRRKYKCSEGPVHLIEVTAKTKEDLIRILKEKITELGAQTTRTLDSIIGG